MNESQLLADCLQLQQSFNSLLLSSVSEGGEPLASFSPYVLVEGSFYVLISELAAHTKNMQVNPRASVLFIESESDAKNIFSRRRVVIQVSVRPLDEDNPQRLGIIAKMQEKHGSTVALLSGLSDFKVFELRPVKGRYVVGFGKAYDWDVKTNKLTHISAELLDSLKEDK